MLQAIRARSYKEKLALIVVHIAKQAEIMHLPVFLFICIFKTLQMAELLKKDGNQTTIEEFPL